MSLARLTYVTVLLGTVFWCTAFVAAPLLASEGWSVADLLYASFHRVCHQLESRSIFLGDFPLGVCARCSAVYLLFLLGVLLYPLVRRVDVPVVPSRWFVLMAALPMVVDALAGILGASEPTLATRIVTGGVFGVLLPFVILPVATEALLQLFPQYSSSVHQEKGITDA